MIKSWGSSNNNSNNSNREKPTITKQEMLKKLADANLLDELNDLTDGKFLTPLDKALEKIITVETPVIEAKEKVRLLAPSNLPVLILGETGVGKELFAQALHGNRVGKFVGVNTAGIPDSLLESEFFGVVKGSYTGCYTDRPGYFEEAANGTLFLDEIGDMPLLLQAKLLRALESKKARRIGSNIEYKIECRIVSATHGRTKIRPDLYYRLAGSIISIPPLRERLLDVIEIGKANGYDFNLEILQSNKKEEIFPGNVRELLNFIKEQKIFERKKNETIG